jgi:hypothetical protein
MRLGMQTLVVLQILQLLVLAQLTVLNITSNAPARLETYRRVKSKYYLDSLEINVNY